MGRAAQLAARPGRPHPGDHLAGRVEEFGAFFYAGKRDELEQRKSELVLPVSETRPGPFVLRTQWDE